MFFAMTFLSCISAVAQTSFDEHFTLAKQGKLGSREIAFAKQCGVDRASSTITYGRSVDEAWTFKRVSSVGNGRNDAEMDYLGNAELWSVNGKPRLINVWFLIMDTGNSSNEMFCLDATGRVITQESLNVYEPVDGSGVNWRHLVVQSIPFTGKPYILRDEYLDLSGSHIAPPKLDKDDLAEANGRSSPDLAKDLIAKISRRTK